MGHVQEPRPNNLKKKLKKVDNKKFRPRPFRFEFMWARDESCELIIQNAWAKQCGRTASSKLASALNNVQCDLRGWDKSHIGNCQDQIRQLKELISTIQALSDTDSRLAQLQLDLKSLETLWDKKSRFSSINYIMNESNHRTVDVDEIGACFERYYKQLFTSINPVFPTDLEELIPESVPTIENVMLCAIPSEEEIREALWSMGSLKCPGPDGMPPFFFKNYWTTVKHDIIAFVHQFFESNFFGKGFNHTFISLIKKTDNASKPSHYRPIALCNISYKIISKILGRRLKVLLDPLISVYQSAFVPGRNIADNSIISHELMHYLHKHKGKKGFMAIKVDMEEAYNRVEWDLLLNILRNFGFTEKFIQMIKHCIATVSFSILINGSPMGLLSPSRGIRQGDPISPYLLILYFELLSRMLNKARQQGFIKGIKVSREAPSFNHLMYADDLTIFCQASTEEAAKVNEILGTFETWTGQKVNKDKSFIHFGKNVDIATKQNISHLMSLKECNHKQKYLGLPFCKGKSESKRAEFNIVIEQFEKSLALSARYPFLRTPVSPFTVEPTLVSLPGVNGGGISDTTSLELPALPTSPRLSRNLSEFRSPSNNFESVLSLINNNGGENILEYYVDRYLESVQANLPNVSIFEDYARYEESIASADDISTTLNSPIKLRHPTHLVTPSEILMVSSPSEVNHSNDHNNEGDVNIRDVVTNSDLRNVEVEFNVNGETKFGQSSADSQDKLQSVANKSKRSFSSQASDVGMEGVRDCRSLPSETYAVEESAQYDATSRGEMMVESLSSQEEAYDSLKDVGGKVSDSAMPPSTQQLSAPTIEGKKQKRKKQKGKNAQGYGSTSPSHSAFNSSDSATEPGKSSNLLYNETPSSQVLAMQPTLDQLMAMQKDIQTQISVDVSIPVTKEGKRLEAALGYSMEKTLKAHSDGVWDQFQEENSRQEKLAREQEQQIKKLITNCTNKDFPSVLEKSINKELTVIGQAVECTVVPTIEKTISTVIIEAFQNGISDKAVNQLEKSVNSKLEATVAKQIQVKFQTSGKQALQESLKSSLEAYTIPAFEMSCNAVFDQVDATFQKGMAEHISASQQKFESSHSPSAITLQETINSASSLTQTLSTDLAESHRKLLADFEVSRTTPNTRHSLVIELGYGPLTGLHGQIEAPMDPTI